MYLSSDWPPYPTAIPPPFRFSFLSSSNITLPLYPSLEWSAKHQQSPPTILHHSSATYLQSYDIWLGGQGKREEAGGEERKEGAGVGRGMKKLKNMEGREKRKKLCTCRSEKGGGRQWAGGVMPTLLSTLSYLKTKATIHLDLNCPHTFWFEAGCNHFENV